MAKKGRWITCKEVVKEHDTCNELLRLGRNAKTVRCPKCGKVHHK